MELKDKEEVVESQGVPEDSSHMSSASSHGRRIRWLLSSASLGNIEEEGVSYEPRVESSASGAMLEVWISIRYMLFVLKACTSVALEIQGKHSMVYVVTQYSRMILAFLHYTLLTEVQILIHIFWYL